MKSTHSAHSWPEVTTCRYESSKSIQPLIEGGESTFAISSARAHGRNRFIWRPGQQAGTQKPRHFILPYRELGWPFKISLTLPVKMSLVLQLGIVRCYHGCICNWDTCSYIWHGNQYVIFQSAEKGDPVRLLLSLSKNLGSDKLMQTFIACFAGF